MESRFTLDSTNWRRARDLLVDALERSAGERAAFLDAACKGEVMLRAEVESLLAAHLHAAAFLENLDTVAASALVDTVDGGFTAPRELAQYRIERLLGRGGMGLVYLAQDTRLDRTVALKFLPHYLSADPTARQQLVAEARAAAALDHTNIAVVHEIVETDAGETFIVMPYYEGKTLSDWLAAGDRTTKECVDVALQIADGLTAAHRRGIVHSDIKPSNILLTTTGVVKILDFGIARFAAREQAERAPTRGTIAYMSPEQTHGDAIGPPSDIWSLGVLLYELIARQRPFTAEDDTRLIQVIREGAPAPLTASADVTPQIAQLVHECLQRDPEERPTADTLAARLRAAPISARRTGKTWVAAVAVLLVLLTGLFARDRGTFGGQMLDEATIAVLPFAGSGADTSLHRLGRDLVVTLSTTLHGGPELRVVDAGSVLAQPAEAVATADAAEDLARRFGAGRLLRGTLVRTSTGVRADAVIIRTATGTIIARASATNARGDLNALTDSLTLSLLTQVWARDAASIPNLAAVTTHSVPALRAYVEGEQAMARADWAAAIAAFERAVAADSTFWFAYWRSLYPRVYESASPADQERVQRLFAERSKFPPADKLLLESRAADGLGQRAILLRRVTTQFPHYWPGWYDYGNYFVHFGPFLGSTYDDAQAVLQRVVELNPAFEPGFEHLFWVAIHQRDTSLATRALAKIDHGPLRAPHRALYEQVVSGRVSDSTRAAVVDIISRLQVPAVIERAATGLLAFGFPAAQVQVLTDLSAKVADPDKLAVLRWARANAWAARGAWDSAFVDVALAQRSAPSNRLALRGYGLAALGLVLGSVKQDAASKLRPSRAACCSPSNVEALAELAWIDGVLAALRKDTIALMRSTRELKRSNARFTAILDRSLAAFAQFARGDARAAANALRALEEENASRALHTRFGADHPFLPAIHRVVASEWFLAAGDTVSAAQLLTWHEAVLAAGYSGEIANRVAEPIALLRRARIEESRQQTGPARRHYQAFLERYDWPPAAHAGWSAAAVEALARLKSN